MITKIFKYIRAGLILGLIMSVALLAVEVYFVVTNSNRPDFWPDDGDTPYQDMSSGLFSAYIHDDNPDYEKMKAKGLVEGSGVSGKDLSSYDCIESSDLIQVTRSFLEIQTKRTTMQSKSRNKKKSLGRWILIAIALTVG